MKKLGPLLTHSPLLMILCIQTMFSRLTRIKVMRYFEKVMIVRSDFKVAVVVEALLFILAFVSSIAFLLTAPRRASHILDVVLIVLWIVVAIALLAMFKRRSDVRDEMVRRFYLSPSWIYNHEIGYAPLEQIMPEHDAYEFVAFAAESLARMSYGFEVASAPDDFSPEYIISTKHFEYRPIKDEENTNEDSVVIDVWRGHLCRVITDDDGQQSFEEIGAYSNATELARLLVANQLIEESQPSESDIMSWESLMS